MCILPTICNFILSTSGVNLIFGMFRFSKYLFCVLQLLIYSFEFLNSKEKKNFKKHINRFIQMNFQFFLFIYFYSNTYMLSYTQFFAIKVNHRKKNVKILKKLYIVH